MIITDVNKSHVLGIETCIRKVWTEITIIFSGIILTLYNFYKFIFNFIPLGICNLVQSCTSTAWTRGLEKFQDVDFKDPTLIFSQLQVILLDRLPMRVHEWHTHISIFFCHLNDQSTSAHHKYRLNTPRLHIFHLNTWALTGKFAVESGYERHIIYWNSLNFHLTCIHRYSDEDSLFLMFFLYWNILSNQILLSLFPLLPQIRMSHLKLQRNKIHIDLLEWETALCKLAQWAPVFAVPLIPSHGDLTWLIEKNFC